MLWASATAQKPALMLLQAYKTTQQPEEVQALLQGSIRRHASARTHPVKGFIVLPVDGNPDSLEALR